MADLSSKKYIQVLSVYGKLKRLKPDYLCTERQTEIEPNSSQGFFAIFLEVKIT